MELSEIIDVQDQWLNTDYYATMMLKNYAGWYDM
jgi:hypothetical protein